MSQGDGRYRHAVDVLSMPDVELNQIIEIMRQKGIVTSSSN